VLREEMPEISSQKKKSDEDIPEYEDEEEEEEDPNFEVFDNLFD
jgi:hypothetical protein